MKPGPFEPGRAGRRDTALPSPVSTGSGSKGLISIPGIRVLAPARDTPGGPQTITRIQGIEERATPDPPRTLARDFRNVKDPGRKTGAGPRAGLPRHGRGHSS